MFSCFRRAARSKQTASKENESGEEMDVFQSSPPAEDIPQEVEMEEEEVSTIRVRIRLHVTVPVDVLFIVHKCVALITYVTNHLSNHKDVSKEDLRFLFSISQIVAKVSVLSG